MCSVCGQNPCDVRCPNAYEEPLICTDCGDEILGRYASLGADEYICEDCLFNNMNGFDLAERLGIVEII